MAINAAPENTPLAPLGTSVITPADPARPRKLSEELAMILRESLQTVGAGTALGLLASVAAGRVIATRLYGVSASDGTTLAAATALLTVVAVAAAMIPAPRASRIDPTIALRSE